MARTKILLVGIGGYGENYIKELLDLGDPTVIIEGIADPYAGVSALYERAVKSGIPFYKSPDDFYRGHSADLAVIASPIHTHCAYTETCLSNGSAVLCEKPICADLDQAYEMLEAERKSGRFVSVGYQLCFSRDVQALKRDIMAGKLGKPLAMKALHLMRRGSTYYGRNGWAGKIRNGSVAIYDSPVSNACAHQLQNMLFLLGDEFDGSAPLEIGHADLYRANPSVENFDTAAFRGKTKSGVEVLYYTAHSTCEKKVGPVSEYRFEKGTVYFGKDGVNEYTVEFNDGRRLSYGDIDKGLRLQKLYDSIECARTGARPACSLKTAIPHIQCVRALQEVVPSAVTDRFLVSLRSDGDEFRCIAGLEAAFGQCYEKGLLPSENGIQFA